MLFDLTTGRRRGVVRVVYGFLALLLGAGLLVGVGSATGTNPFAESGDGGGLEAQAQERIERADAAVRANPRDAEALAALVRARVDVANSTADPETAAYSAEGRRQLQRADGAWRRYLALDPETPDAGVAQRMVAAYSEIGLRQPARAADAQEIVVTAALQRAEAASQEPPWQPTAVLAQLLYQAGDREDGRRAARRAAALAPEDQRAAVRQQLEAVATQSAAGTAGGQAPPG